MSSLFEVHRNHTQRLPEGVALPPHAAEALVLAHLLDRMLKGRPAKQADAPAWFEQAGMMAREFMVEATRDAPKVGPPHSNVLRSVFVFFIVGLAAVSHGHRCSLTAVGVYG